jgi:hypothetical protein
MLGAFIPIFKVVNQGLQQQQQSTWGSNVVSKEVPYGLIPQLWERQIPLLPTLYQNSVRDAYLPI